MKEYKYLVTWDYLIGGKYRPMEKTVTAANAKEATQRIKSKYVPGYTRYPFHVEAKRIREEN